MVSPCHRLKATQAGLARQRAVLRWAGLALVLFAWVEGCGKGEAAQDRGVSPAPPADTAAENPPLAAEPAAAGPTVVFLGDSLSAGLHLPADQAFPAVVQRRLAAAGLPFRLLNAGVSGDTTAGGAQRLDWLLAQDPAIVVVELGGNDGLRGVPLASIEQNLRAILERIRARGARPLLLGMRIPPNYGPEYTRGFEAIYARLAQELDVPLVAYFMEGVAGVPELNLSDGLHPTAQGHERLADNVIEVLKQQLAQVHSAASAGERP